MFSVGCPSLEEIGRVVSVELFDVPLTTGTRETVTTHPISSKMITIMRAMTVAVLLAVENIFLFFLPAVAAAFIPCLENFPAERAAAIAIP
jgi:hypothetical protein